MKLVCFSLFDIQVQVKLVCFSLFDIQVQVKLVSQFSVSFYPIISEFFSIFFSNKI